MDIARPKDSLNCFKARTGGPIFLMKTLIKRPLVRLVQLHPELYAWLCRRLNTNTVEYWDAEYRKAGALEKWQDATRAHFYDLIAEVLPKQPLSVLDVGSGLGAGAIYLQSKYVGWQVEGLDFSPEACRTALVKTHCVDLRTEEIPGRYDYVVAAETLEHMNEPREVLEKLIGAARLGVLITVPYRSGLSPVHPARFDETTFAAYPGVTLSIHTQPGSGVAPRKRHMLVVVPTGAAPAIAQRDGFQRTPSRGHVTECRRP